MARDVSPKPGKLASFFRACRYLGPYRKIVSISVVSALFVGLFFTGGLGAMLPILRVLINEDTVVGWVDRQIVEQRIDVTLADNAHELRVVRVKPDGVAARASVHAGDVIQFDVHADNVAGVPAHPMPFGMDMIRSIAARMPTDPVRAIGVLFLAILAMGLVGNVIRFFQEYLSDKAAISAVNDIRRNLYDHVLHMHLSFFGREGTSDVTSRLVSDAQMLQDGFKTVLGQSVQEPIKALLALSLALWVDWRLTLFIIAFGPLMFAVIRKFGKKMRRASRAMMQKNSTMLGQIEGTLSGIRVVKGASAERFERRRYRGILGLLRIEQLKMARYEAMATPAMETCAFIAIGCVVMVAAYLMFVKHSLSTSSFFLIMACLMGIGESLRKVSKLNSVLARSNSAAARIFETMDIPMERVRHSESRANLAPIQHEIVFENLNFSYPGAQTPALCDVNLTVKKGQSIAVVGRNGSGKTTLLAMLPRFYDPDRGRILIDGVDIQNATLRSLRGQIAIVTQEATIFPGTIAENIAYGLPLASREQIEAAARRAFCHEFIMEKPQGYDTPLDGLGAQLSGGQRQRLNIARAILRTAPILVLDEATSQVDAESEHLIQQAIESIIHERTTFVIAHRFSTILSADTIIVMDRGRIVGQGKHEELLGSCATYQQLYERQLFAAPAKGEGAAA